MVFYILLFRQGRLTSRHQPGPQSTALEEQDVCFSVLEQGGLVAAPPLQVSQGPGCSGCASVNGALGPATGPLRNCEETERHGGLRHFHSRPLREHRVDACSAHMLSAALPPAEGLGAVRGQGQTCAAITWGKWPSETSSLSAF